MLVSVMYRLALICEANLNLEKREFTGRDTYTLMNLLDTAIIAKYYLTHRAP